MKIIVTGGAGFIASHVTDAYIKAGHKVVIIDNLSTGKKENLNKKAKFYKADIRNLKSLEAIFKKEKPQIVNHHAAIAEIAKSLRDPKKTYESNILGTGNILIASGKNKIKKVISVSSGGAIYGDQKKIPVSETAEPQPLSPYALSKLAGEEFVKYYAKFYGFDYLIYRYANVYGPRQNPKGEAGVIAIFPYLIKSGRMPKIFGNGTKTRDYVYIEDISRANLLGLTKGKNEALNFGIGKEISDFQVFKTIAKNLDYKKSPIYLPFRKGEVMKVSLNPRKAKKIIDWEPRVDFETGVRRYLASIS